jgi:hypothetical protein
MPIYRGILLLVSGQSHDRDNLTERRKTYQRLSKYLMKSYERVRIRRPYTRREVDPAIREFRDTFRGLRLSLRECDEIKQRRLFAARREASRGCVYIEAVPESKLSGLAAQLIWPRG